MCCFFVGCRYWLATSRVAWWLLPSHSSLHLLCIFKHCNCHSNRLQIMSQETHPSGFIWCPDILCPHILWNQKDNFILTELPAIKRTLGWQSLASIRSILDAQIVFNKVNQITFSRNTLLRFFGMGCRKAWVLAYMGRKKTLERSLLVFISWIFFSRIPFGIYAETSFAIPQKGPS